MSNWFVCAILSAVFAALTSILAKIGIEGVNSNLATAIRTVVVLLLAWGLVFGLGLHADLKHITGRSLLFLCLSGLATGLSWLFYYRALQLGQAHRVASVDKMSIVFTLILAVLILGESVSWKGLLGVSMIAFGTLVMIL